jgi:hypothetical protein
MINEILEHNGCEGTVQFSESDKYFFGRLIDSPQFTYEARNRDDLETAFKAAVNEYERKSAYCNSER